jgi:biotin synthase-like enzyme
MKYKFEETVGCTASSLLVNKEEFYDLSEKEQDEIIDYLLLKIKESYKEHEINLTDLLHLLQYTDYEMIKENCDQCGDSVSITTWEV